MQVGSHVIASRSRRSLHGCRTQTRMCFLPRVAGPREEFSGHIAAAGLRQGSIATADGRTSFSGARGHERERRPSCRQHRTGAWPLQPMMAREGIDALLCPLEKVQEKFPTDRWLRVLCGLRLTVCDLVWLAGLVGSQQLFFAAVVSVSLAAVVLVQRLIILMEWLLVLRALCAEPIVRRVDSTSFAGAASRSSCAPRYGTAPRCRWRSPAVESCVLCAVCCVPLRLPIDRLILSFSDFDVGKVHRPSVPVSRIHFTAFYWSSAGYPEVSPLLSLEPL